MVTAAAASATLASERLVINVSVDRDRITAR